MLQRVLRLKRLVLVLIVIILTSMYFFLSSFYQRQKGNVLGTNEVPSSNKQNVASPSPQSSPTEIPCNGKNLIAGKCILKNKKLVTTMTPESSTPSPSTVVTSSLQSLAEATPLPVSQTPSPRPIPNLIANGDVEKGLIDWVAQGNITAVSQTENGAAPFETTMIRIGSDNSDPDFDGQLIQNNKLSQTIYLQGDSVKTLSFWYNVGTYENMFGFDEPAFLVHLNNQSILQVWASDIHSDEVLKTSGWKFFSIDISQLHDSNITISFFAGNTGDLKKQSFAYVDNISTGGELLPEVTHFNAIDDLTAFRDSDQDFTLTWTAPADSTFTNSAGFNKAIGYDLRYSTNPIDSTLSDADWEKLPKANVSGGMNAPQLGSQKELYQLHLENPSPQVWFVLRSLDQYGHKSVLSNIGSLL